MSVIKEKPTEELSESIALLENQNCEKSSEFTKPENKDSTEVKKTTPPTKKDLIVRKLKYQLK